MSVLIYYHERFLTPTGGPSGYLYNLKNRRDVISDDEICFLGPEGPAPSFMYRLERKLRKRDKSLPANAARIEEIIYESGKKGPYDLDQFDAVHFHSTFDMYSQKKTLESYKGKVILTSHTPKAPHKEFIEDYTDKEEYEKYKELFDKTEEFDKYAFERADYIVFPCEGAEEPYFHTWDQYPAVRRENRIRYLPTGTPRCTPGRTREEIRRGLGIAEDRFVISFVGRHNEVKGYDRLIRIFDKLEGVTIVCCGNPGAIVPPESPDWIEVGWTDDPYSYVNASDLFILPNRETYFDLSLLETISVGKRALISLTGGNRVFEGRNDSGIYTFENEDEASAIIRRLMKDDPSAVKEEESDQIKLYNEEYTIEKFYERYKELLGRICDGR